MPPPNAECVRALDLNGHVKRERNRQDESAVVVSVLADQVDAPARLPARPGHPSHVRRTTSPEPWIVPRTTIRGGTTAPGSTRAFATIASHPTPDFGPIITGCSITASGST